MSDGGPQAGWYDDPELPGSVRYWDGTVWTFHRAPAPSAPEQSRAGPALGLAAAGFFVAPLGVVGLIMGIIELRRMKAGRVDPKDRGMAVAAVAIGGVITAMIVAFLAILIVFVLVAGDPGPPP